jgi:hypothetical protein
MSARKNPYREGSAYHKVFESLRASGKKGISRKELMVMGHKATDITVVLSPRLESTRGDIRGNRSSQGHLYFARKLVRRVVGDMKEPQRFSLGWRKKNLQPLKHGEKYEVASKKVATEASTKVKAGKKAKAKV